MKPRPFAVSRSGTERNGVQNDHEIVSFFVS